MNIKLGLLVIVRGLAGDCSVNLYKKLQQLYSYRLRQALEYAL